MDKTQKRWSFIVNVLYILIFIAAFYLFMKYAFWVFMPFIVALIIAALLQKPLKALTKSNKLPKGATGAVLSLTVFAVIIGIFVFGGVRIGIAIKDLISYFTERCTSLAGFFEVLKNAYLDLEIARMIPPDFNNYITSGIDSLRDFFLNGNFFDTLTNNISSFISPIGSVISTVPSFLAGFLVSIISTCFMTPAFDDIKAFIVRQFKDGNKVVKAKNILVSSIGKMIKAYTIIILITTFELFIGLSILKLIGVNGGTHNFAVSVVIALIDIVPVLGTGTILLPWSVYSFVSGNIGMGIGILVIYAAVSVIRQVIEPKLVAGQVGISPVVTIMAMYLGIRIFGAIGIFVLPLIVIIIKLLNDEGIIHLFNSNPKDIKYSKEDFDENPENNEVKSNEE